ncbi:endonuclease domain-containing protein [Streptomyces chrestomyceticus]|uniref:endonuclease domain-containing protein n=1 Tax=Streptomyces chrestomyceticus TaxID=68185 RepID=UPI003F4CD528
MTGPGTGSGARGRAGCRALPGSPVRARTHQPSRYRRTAAGPERERPPLPSSGPVRSRVHVDHDRRTGKVRDVLCFSCNAALGQFKDRPDVLGRRPNIRKETCGSQHS